MKYLRILLVFGIVAILADLLGWNPLLVFIFSGLAMVPLAGLMGEATEVLAVHTGPRLGGLLNATLGNAAELIITIMAIREGILNPAINDQMLELVRASLTGSIMGNILLVLGLSVLVGGLRHGTQKFDRSHAGTNATMLMLAVAALIIPSIFSHSIEVVNHDAVEYLSLGVAGVMILLYVLWLIYQLCTSSNHILDDDEYAAAKQEAPHWSVAKALIVLLIATGAIVWMSELLVGTVEHVVLDWHYRVLPGDHHRPPHWQCGRAPGGGYGSSQEPDGAEPRHFGGLKSAGRPLCGAFAGVRQPADGQPFDPSL